MVRVTRYLPIARVKHDETGHVIEVEIDWAESMTAIEQEVDENIANELSQKFDDWLEEQSQATGPGHWRWEA